jgi:hypothetical protein
MKYQRCLIFGATACLCAALGSAAKNSATHARALAFEELTLHLEVDLPGQGGLGAAGMQAQSLLDLPAELALEASAEQSLARIEISDGAGSRVLTLQGQRTGSAGLTEVSVECEAPTLAELLREFPPGTYRVLGTALDGSLLLGTAALTTQFPGLFSLVSPVPGSTLATEAVFVSWTPSAGARDYELEIEQEAIGMSFSIRLPPEQIAFHVPPEILEHAQNYDISLTVRGDTDNELEIETSFSTAPRASGR